MTMTMWPPTVTVTTLRDEPVHADLSHDASVTMVCWLKASNVVIVDVNR